MSNYKSSIYNIFSEEINCKKERIVYSTRSCKPLLISEYVHKELIANNLNKIPSGIIDTLIKNKILVEEHENELHEVIKENIKLASSFTDHLYEVIQPTSDCQLDCIYCGQTHSNTLISDNTCFKVVQRIQKKLKDNNFKTLTIGWFGGEPLMAIDAIKLITESLIKFCDSNSIKYSGKIVTNGVGLNTELFEMLVTTLNIHEIEITLDGTKEFHDQYRITKNQNGSFDIIFRNLINIVEKKTKDNLKCNISIRCNINRFNASGVSPLLNLLAEYNLAEHIQFYVKSIYSWAQNNAHKNAIPPAAFAQKEMEWIKEMINLSFPSPINIPKRRFITCIANSPFSEMYDAYGNIFNCSEVSYSDIYKNSRYLLGNLSDETSIKKNEIYSSWQHRILTGKSLPCSTCNILPICGGSCPKAWFEGNPPCPPIRYNLMDKLQLKFVHASNHMKTSSNP